jgi:hypothetical protein
MLGRSVDGDLPCVEGEERCCNNGIHYQHCNDNTADHSSKNLFKCKLSNQWELVKGALTSWECGLPARNPSSPNIQLKMTAA